MEVLAISDFGEFYTSDFFLEFSYTDSDGKIVLESPESKIVSEEQEEMFDTFFIYSFYKKGPKRWVKKMEASNEQVFFDFEVRLMVDEKTGDPVSIIFDDDRDTFEFILSPEMVRALQDAMKYELEGYYPNLLKK